MFLVIVFLRPVVNKITEFHVAARALLITMTVNIRKAFARFTHAL